MSDDGNPDRAAGDVAPAAPQGSCERARLLLSLAADGAETPSQRAELAAHAAACGPCRAAALADRAVAARLRLRTSGAVSPGFASRVADAVRRAQTAAAENRFLRRAAVAAAVVAAVGAGVIAWSPGSGGDAGGPGPREVARSVVVRPSLHGDR